MRVLVLSNMYPPHHLGGYEMSCRDVVARWRVAGHEVHVLTTDFHVDTDETDVDPSVMRSLEWYWHDHAFVCPAPVPRFLLERRNHARLRAALDRVRPDVVSVWHMGGMSLGLLTAVAQRKLPLTYVVCDDWPTYGPDFDPWAGAWSTRPTWGRWFTRLTGTPTVVPDLSGTGPFCFVSEFTRRKVLSLTSLRPRESAVVPSGISTDDFPVSVRPPRLWSGRLLCVGRVEPRKGFASAVRALAGLPGTTLRIVGPTQPAHLSELRSLAASLGVADRLEFDQVPRSALAAVYSDADVLLFTSDWEEPFGLVPLEAMACSTPVVACATGGSAEFLAHEENCLVVPARDVDALVRSVDALAANENLRDTVTAGGRATAASLTMERYATDLETWHEKARSGTWE